jgi:hypothetical protein
MLAQQNAIGGTEVVDVDSFERVASTDLAILRPAIKALRSRKQNRLKEFEDLLFGPRFQQLQRLLGVEPPDSRDDDDDDLEEPPPSRRTDDSGDDENARSADDSQKAGRLKRANAFVPPPPSTEWDDNLPTVDPLMR